MNTFPDSDRTWRWLALWCAWLLPLALLFPPIPVDETRYLTAAWEMFNSGQWLVPTVNGAWYPDKSPLLFWLIAGAWKIFGVHTWVPRVEALIVALGMLLTVRRLAVRLGMDARGAATALWLLAGSFGFAVFTTAIMFDLLLAVMVLGALHALLDLDAGKWKRGTALLGVMIGLGILAKGPVMLLDIAGAAVLAPLWSPTASRHKPRWYAAMLAGSLIGVAIALCWLLPAAWYAGPGYWQPLIDKVTGRIAGDFGHSRSWWWYLPWLPLLLLPWLLIVRAPRAAWRRLPRQRAGRFALCWWVPPFIAFCAISGKQIHYLLPLLPAWALAGAWLLQQDGARLRSRLAAVLGLPVGVWIATLPWQASDRFGYPPPRAVAWLALVALVVAVGVWRLWGRDVRKLALAATALIATTLLAVALVLRPSLDVRPEAAFVKQAMHGHVPIATVGSNNGLFGYTGRLHQPMPWIPRDRILTWSRAHPDGILLTSDPHVELKGIEPSETWPYFLAGDHRIAAWRASDLLAANGFSEKKP